jgi:methionine-rich copper-binding protein CopC
MPYYMEHVARVSRAEHYTDVMDESEHDVLAYLRLMSMSFRLRRRRTLATIGLVAAAMQGGPMVPARCEDGMSVVEQMPTTNQIIAGSAVSFLLRFDRPIDHEHSEFVLITPKGVRRILPRLESEPNVLYASVGRLPPGTYELRWRARAGDGSMLSGTIPFRVREA